MSVPQSIETLELLGRTDAQILARVNADRRPRVDLTIGAISDELTANGHDGQAILGRVLPAIYALIDSGQAGPVAESIVHQMRTEGGTADIGNPDVQSLIGAVASDDDLAAIVEIVPGYQPFDQAALDAYRQQRSIDQAKQLQRKTWVRLYNAHIAAILDDENRTAIADLAAAVDALRDALAAELDQTPTIEVSGP